MSMKLERRKHYRVDWTEYGNLYSAWYHTAKQAKYQAFQLMNNADDYEKRNLVGTAPRGEVYVSVVYEA